MEPPLCPRATTARLLPLRRASRAPTRLLTGLVFLKGDSALPAAPLPFPQPLSLASRAGQGTTKLPVWREGSA